MYVVVPTKAVLTVAGFQVPVIPFTDVKGNNGAGLFWHKAPSGSNVGITFGLTFIVNVAVVAH